MWDYKIHNASEHIKKLLTGKNNYSNLYYIEYLNDLDKFHKEFFLNIFW